jgi:hypothetical protein
VDQSILVARLWNRQFHHCEHIHHRHPGDYLPCAIAALIFCVALCLSHGAKLGSFNFPWIWLAGRVFLFHLNADLSILGYFSVC